jgi:hypothetical protein
MSTGGSGRTLEKLAPPSTRSHPFRADDKLLVFLSNLSIADQTLG